MTRYDLCTAGALGHSHHSRRRKAANGKIRSGLGDDRPQAAINPSADLDSWRHNTLRGGGAKPRKPLGRLHPGKLSGNAQPAHKADVQKLREVPGDGDVVDLNPAVADGLHDQGDRRARW